MMKNLLLLLTLLPLSLFAQTPEEKGLAIAMAADKADSGWGDQVATMRMILRNANGDTSEREIKVKTLEVDGDGDKSLTIFYTPRDLNGTAFLSFTHALEPDDQWLYLPALKRVKRISSANKSGPFMGSEFAYEDISSQEVEKYSYKWLRDESIEGRNTHVIERTPKYQHSGYTRQIAWIDEQMLQPVKVEFYDRKNALLKTLTHFDYQQYLGQYWRVSRMEMVNHLTKKSTSLEWNEYKFRQGLDDSDFNRNKLKRAR